jgi:hypothetical protein
MHFEAVYLPGFPMMKSALESIGKISFINYKYGEQRVVVQECDATDA